MFGEIAAFSHSTKISAHSVSASPRHLAVFPGRLPAGAGKHFVKRTHTGEPAVEGNVEGLGIGRAEQALREGNALHFTPNPL
jgi:hypothetical protein